MCFWFILYNIEHSAVKSNFLDFYERWLHIVHLCMTDATFKSLSKQNE